MLQRMAAFSLMGNSSALLTRVLVRLDHVARVIVKANYSAM
jgi:hypothetical protein